ncbi:MAG: PilZ domain-containing protein [Sulfuricaulis sp.]|uniref:PilZ domain-containing protein n=1 Tax=Sulfuricaulis sp. TaxID=2003553 RepID=UPI003C516027
MKDRRRYPRRREFVPMSVMPTGTGEARTLVTRDISAGGTFLYAKASEQLPVGTELMITPLQPTAGLMPSIKGRVVRVSPQGMGIEFSEPTVDRTT